MSFNASAANNANMLTVQASRKQLTIEFEKKDP